MGCNLYKRLQSAILEAWTRHFLGCSVEVVRLWKPYKIRARKLFLLFGKIIVDNGAGFVMVCVSPRWGITTTNTTDNMTTSEIESEIRRIRGVMFSLSEHDQERAGESIDRLKARLAEARKAPEKKGPFSGLTRKELAASGTCEADWF